MSTQFEGPPVEDSLPEGLVSTLLVGKIAELETPQTNAASDHYFTRSEANNSVALMPKMQDPPEKQTLQNQRYSNGDTGILASHGDWTENLSETNLPA